MKQLMETELHRIDTRLPQDVIDRIDAIAKRFKVSRGYAMRMAIAFGLREVELTKQREVLREQRQPGRGRALSGRRD
jgi:predicted transcriptional regulator